MRISAGQLIMIIVMTVLMVGMITGAAVFSAYGRIADSRHFCSSAAARHSHEKMHTTCEKCASAEKVKMTFPRIMRARKLVAVIRREGE